MNHYIDKAALVAEIERRMQELRPTNTHKMQTGEKMDRDVLMWLNALTWVKKVIDTLEVKEVEEKPVSEDLEEAARKVGQKYFPNEENIWARPNYEAKKAEYAFMEGAQWQKEQLMKDAVYGLVCGHDESSPAWIDLNLLNKPSVKVGTEVKLIIIKDE